MRRMTSAIALSLGVITPAAHGVVLYELVSGTNSSTLQNASPDLLSQTGYVRGPGITSNSGGTFNSTGFTVGTASADAAVTAGDFITWSFALSSSYDLDSFSIRYDRSGTGPTQLRIELDTGAGFQSVWTDSAIAEAGENVINVSLASFDVVTSGTFRLAAFGASGGSGTFDFENTGSINNASFQLNGTFNGSSGGGGPDPDPTPVPTPVAIVADSIIGPDNQAPLLGATQIPTPNSLPTGDGFQIFQRGVNDGLIPFALLDDSLSIFPADSQGIVRGGDTGAFFGVTDLVNGEPLSEINPGDGTGTADFRFNITGMTDIQVAIDMAAMGDFENSNDVFNFTYSIDGSTFQSLFTSSVDETGSLTYLLEGGPSFNLADPLLMNGTLLNNLFQTLTANVIGTGSELILRFFSTTDGGTEAFAFRNIEITSASTQGPGNPGGPNGAIPEPTTATFGLAGLMLLAMRRRRHGAADLI